ncbi:85/88 kDa calcium-independent phospholipase A2-like [Oppia nitens]|uniref:85/88 kDa calcium-independent phospholipase A2-like n=1 Tax=Oppia nitens TaxID=1686743 RepID=UPI0023DB9518|nr:85/88 kDa calcium-independent phospholipase A2-like [Oppia nitens]
MSTPMSYLDRMVSLFRKNISDYPPFQVVEVKPEDYVHYNVVAREDPVVLYSNISANHEMNYEIVVLKDLQSKTAFSLIRSKTSTDIDIYYKSLSQKIPQIFLICPNNITTELLQEISNYVKEHLNQSLAHICAYFLQLNEYFRQLTPNDSEVINCRCPDTGLTPLHIAVRMARLPTVQLLLALSPKLDIVDKENNNVLHFAANTTKEIISKICLSAQSSTSGVNLLTLINARNKDNFSPLYLACHNDKPDCIKELLKNGANLNAASIVNESHQEVREVDDKTVFDQLDTKDMKNGGTPLHWTNTPQCMEVLIEMGCNIDARNFQGETVLHLMVMRNKLSCVITLLSYGGDASAKGSNGNTPLHLAVKSGQVSMVQALVVFGADINVQNSSGETARHMAASAKRTSQMDLILYVLHSVGAKRCLSNRSNCTDGCSQSNGSHFNGIPPESSPFKRSVKLYDELLGELIVKEALNRKKAQQMSVDFDSEPPKRCRVLCLDGGGIRGLILIQMLWVLEKLMDKKMSECFDWMSGTSTGGILALLLALGHSAHECRQLYFRLKDKVFVGLLRPYESEPLEKFLQKTLGEDTRMSDIKKPKIMITATVADRFPPDIQLFRNYESPNEILGFVNHIEPIPDMPKPHDQLVWKTARSSGAAPTYFRPCDAFLDGGLISNNPTLDTLSEICSLNKAFSVMNRKSSELNVDLVVSLGTGAIPIKQMPIIDICRPDTFMGVAKTVFSANSLVQLLIEQACQADGQVVERAKAWCSQINVPYFRLNPPLSEDIPLNEIDNTKLVNMLWETTAYMYSRTNEIQELILLLF